MSGHWVVVTFPPPKMEPPVFDDAGAAIRYAAALDNSAVYRLHERPLTVQTTTPPKAP